MISFLKEINIFHVASMTFFSFLYQKRSSGSDFICPGLGLYPAGVCSSFFYQCAEEFGELVAYRLRCPDDLVFDTLISTCNYRQDVEVIQACVSVRTTPSSLLNPLFRNVTCPTVTSVTWLDSIRIQRLDKTALVSSTSTKTFNCVE